MNVPFVECCLLLFLQVGTTKDAPASIDPDLMDGKRGNPGMKFRLLDEGLDYLRDVAMRVLNKEIPHLRLPTIKESVNGNPVYIRKIRIVDYKKPSKYYLKLVKPNGFQWKMKNMGLTATGRFSGSYQVLLLKLHAQGRFDTYIKNLNFETTIDTGMSRGRFTVRVKKCYAKIGSMNIKISEAGVLMDIALNFFQGVIVSIVKPLVERQMCKRVKEIIDRDVNNIVKTMPLKIGLGGVAGHKYRNKRAASESDESSYEYDYEEYDFSSEESRNKPKASSEEDRKNIDLEGIDLVRRFKAMANDLVLDMYLTKRHSFTSSYVTGYHNGEISWKGKGNTPFYPPTMSDKRTSRSMAHLYVTDYVVNSLLYHLYDQKLLSLYISPRNMPRTIAKMLTTTCDSFCAGDLLLGLGEAYPDHQVEIYFVPLRAPTAFFKDGNAQFKIFGLVRLYARNPKKEKRYKVLDAGVFLGAELTMRVKNKRIVGKVEAKKLEIKLVESDLDEVTQDDLEYIADMAKDMINQMSGQILAKGIPIPTVTGIDFRNSKLKFYTHYAFIESDFRLDENYVHRLVNSAFKQGMGG